MPPAVTVPSGAVDQSPAYNSARPAEWMSVEAKLPIVVLPFTIGSTPKAKDLTALFDDTVARLLASLK